MLLINGQVIWFAVELPGTSKYYLNTRVCLSTGLKDRKLCCGVDFKISLRVGHRVHVARLSSKIKQVILPFQQVSHCERIADIADIHRDRISNIYYVEWITSVFRN